ncbi:TPA: conjugal transfer protein TraG [Pseudomonas aeruginosa]|jgi:type IV secretion system protein VirD4|uniref:Conjugal transfer protein TraG n=19 Tax=cellular organisms TaxID=131567 RepID=A0A5C5UBK4_9GAMM|nr:MULTISPECIES: conjugal transfer protein TraG [Pseudomonadota]AIO46737.1 type IV secretory system Conjugative DNA transfer family protein [Burkholderia cepacia]EBF6272194.1 conjugal transfer protein TraG [Salmonella enterica]EHF4998190.1 conjugal transfer protein TraG [Enterobacter hormaechei]EIW8581867.1 conjugal transfer protein TraG [Klebsiella pneumoniae]KYZ84741.1 conjugal transfer protein TraG [Alcanivorax sp. KX64203]MBK81061.1 conjugal transfer protein TraG [Gammaproteobacteria bact
MQGTNVLFGQIAVVFGIVIAGVWGATQWTAAALGYQVRLGSPWFDLLGTPIYHPWKLFEWWFSYGAYTPEIFDTGGAIAGSSGMVAVAVAIAMSVWRSRQARLVTTYGSARWANAHDIRKAGLTQPEGVFLGQHDRQYLRHEGPEHVLTFAPTRSGKGVGLVVPTLLSWPASAVIHDIKGENWQITAGWRSRFSHCLLFNPTDAKSAAYNPLLEVRRGAHEVRDVQNIADILVDPEGALEKRNHWEKTSHALLVGAILHVLYAGEDKTLRGVANFLSDPASPFELTLHRMMTTPHLGEGPHPVVASAAREVLNKSDNERSGVLSTAMSFLGLYRDPTVAEVTSRCDWRIADLIAAEHPVSLYLVVPPSDISRTKPLIRLILNQIGRRLTESLDGSDGIERRHKLLLMLDEFPALGRLDFFETALAFMAGYGIRSFLIAQSLNQIDKAYGQNHSILDNCHVRVTFATNDERTAKRISETLGTATELRAQRNYAGHRLAPWLGHLMVSRQETARPLLTPGEVMQLPPDDAVVMVSSMAPIKARKLRYYADANFKQRVLPPPELADGRYADAPPLRPDDWSGLAIPAVPAAPAADAAEGFRASADDGGPRRQPELTEAVAYDPELAAPAADLGLLDDDDDLPLPLPRQLDPAMQRTARLASLDPNDGIEL